MLREQSYGLVAREITRLSVRVGVSDEELRDPVSDACVCLEAFADDGGFDITEAIESLAFRIQNQRIKNLRVKEHLVYGIGEFLSDRVSVIYIECSASASFGIQVCSDGKHIF